MKAPAVTRRQFVLVASAVGGALVLGVAARRLRRRSAAAVGAGGNPVGTLNAFVRIGPDEKITLVMPQIDASEIATITCGRPIALKALATGAGVSSVV